MNYRKIERSDERNFGRLQALALYIEIHFPWKKEIHRDGPWRPKIYKALYLCDSRTKQVSQEC